MYEYGICRKIDGMGRLVIPKEIRDRYNIKENDYLEFYLIEDGFNIKKHSKLGRVKQLTQELTDIINQFLNAEVLIAERDKILAYSGNKKDEFLDKEISNELFKSINRRESLFEAYKKDLKLVKDSVINCSYINETIVSNCEEVGIICLFREDRSVDETDLKVIKIVSSFLTKYLEE